MTDRHGELLRYFQEHFDAEQENDIERTLKTLSPDIVYEHPFREHEPTISGIDEVRAYYLRQWGNVPYQAIRIVRSWLCGDDTIFTETESTVGHPGDERRIRTMAIGIFRDGLLVREIVYNGPYMALSPNAAP